MPSSTTERTGPASRIELGDVLLWGLCGAAVLGVVVVQLAWIIAFDTSGLDRVVPDVFMTTFGPSATVALAPAAVAYWRGDATLAGVAGGLVFLVALALSSFTIGFYGLCGPGC